MEISIYREPEKIVVIIEHNFTVTTYQFYNATITEIGEFLRALQGDDEK